MKKKKNLRFGAGIVSWLLVIAMVTESFLGSGSIVLAADQEEAELMQGAGPDGLEGSIAEGSLENSSSGEYSTEGLDILFEVEEHRDRTSKHYRLSDGSIMAADYGMDIHYEENGEWKDIDNRFIYEAATDEDPMEGFSTAEGSVKFKFAPDTGDGEVVRAAAGGYSVGFELLEGSAAVSGDAGVSQMQLDDAASVEHAGISDTDSMKNGAVAGTQAEGADGHLQETAPVPITFIKGEILNEAEAPLAAGMGDLHAEPVSSYAANAVCATEAADDAASDAAWADAGMEAEDTDGERTLMEQAALEHAVTSVGYGSIRPGVSLQYIASGSSLKEYILLSERQDSYVYSFAVNTGSLEAEMQENGSILLCDPADGTCVYEIPAAYMTDAAGAYSDAVAMELAQTGEGEYLLTLSADPAWIDDEARVFPVQIDPTLNERLSSSSNIKGFYVIEEKPDVKTEWYGWMYAGYDGAGYGNMATYIQLRDLEALPQDSVICASYFNMAVVGWDDYGCPKLHLQAKRLAEKSVWETKYCYRNRPGIADEVIDVQTLTEANLTDNDKRYAAWNITELVKEHYEAGNQPGAVLDFALESAAGMRDGHYANAALNLTWNGAEPVLQTFYRDTKGVEDYYTYQTQSIGHAGTGYISDYSLQLAIAKDIAAYNHAAMDLGISIVYNSACSGSYFTNGGNIHTKDFSKMNTGMGWKLSLQETVVPVSVTDLGSTAEYLVYNDSDGTEHYFRYDKETKKYEDEDGLGLTISKSGTDYTMTDRKDNKKLFINGYLTEISDANGNKVCITYNAQQQISSVVLDTVLEDPVTVYSFIYDPGVFCLVEIRDHASGRSHILDYENTGGFWRLVRIKRRYGGNASADAMEAQYSYDPSNGRLLRAYDSEKGTGVEYTYYKSGTGYRVYECMEFAADSIFGAGLVYGAKMRGWPRGMRQTRYRYHGMDQTMDTSDDIVTTYLFNSSGQTVNGISENGTEEEMLGVTAAAYTQNSGTDKRNNRMSGSISSGQAGMNLLVNGGFEKAGSTETEAAGWSAYISRGNAARRTDSTSSKNAYDGTGYYNLYGSSSSSLVSLYQDAAVEQGKTYTFSAYVNTQGITEAADDGGVYLYVSNITTQERYGESVKIGYRTSQALDGGWQRLTVTFAAPSSMTVRFAVCSYHVHGTIRADSVQMEKSSAASRFSHVYNADFEKADGDPGWSVSGNGTVTVTQEEKKHGSRALKMEAAAPEAALCAEQTINLYTGAGTTFLLSGWGKADSAPDFAQEIEGKDDASLRYFGITLTLHYSDGASQHFHLPFCDYAEDWQYAAMSVTPAREHAGKTVTTAVLKLHYRNNANTAYFDSISLTEEPAQTYTYDEEGNLVSVKSTGNGEDEYQFENGMDLSRAATEGSGVYDYVYKESGNTHLPVQIKNDNVAMDITYDANGQTAETVLKDDSKDGSDLYMKSSAVYNNGLLRKLTDNTGSYAAYGYDSRRRLIKTSDAAGNEIWTEYDDIWDRPRMSYQSGYTAVTNTYAEGRLAEIKRKGYVAVGGTPVEQKYSFTYDAFGRNTSVSVGNYKVADYRYNGAGLLERMDYGTTDTPQAVASYTYDGLERVKEVSYYNNGTNETLRYGYLYASDGNLAGITKDGELVYSYEHDSLGRLIRSSMLEDGKPVLRTEHAYDTSNRILSQSWQIGDDAFTESYVYEEKDGTLKQMGTGGDTLSFAYDALKRFDARTSPVMTVDYDYRNSTDDADKTTTQVAQISYKKSSGTGDAVPALGYAYDAVGNIKTVTSGGSTKKSYSYDAQNQLAAENIYGYRGGTLHATYTYDTYGNIRSIYNSLSGVTSEHYVLEYGNSAWLDRLTKVTYTDEDGNVGSGTLTYDQIGNPLTYFNGRKNWNFTWKFGRQLTEASSGADTVSYTYDVDGIRQSKTVNGSMTEYTTLDGKVVRETKGGVTTDYFYDNEGKPYKIVVENGTASYVGYYVLNQQGDVIAILDDTGSAAVKYEYNAWGRILGETATGTAMSTYLKTYNHLKYRGYYYDSETGFYYVSSRYYDPEIGRFISPDSAISGIGGDVRGYNLYSYCMNNPVNMSDPDGNWPKWVQKIGNTVKSAVKSVVNAVKTTVAKYAKKTSGVSNKRPPTGEPGSTYVAPNGDRRTYGPDGKPVHDYDHSDHGNPKHHPHDENGGHHHDWDWTKNPPRQDPYIPTIEQIAGVGLVTISSVGIAVVALDNLTGVGIADDFLYGPLGAGVSQGLIMIY